MMEEKGQTVGEYLEVADLATICSLQRPTAAQQTAETFAD